MRVALFTDGIWPYTLGGMQKHSYIFAMEMARKGIDVDLYLPVIQGISDADILEKFPEALRGFITPIPVDRPKFPASIPGAYMRSEYFYSKNVYRQMLQKNQALQFIYAQGLTAWYILKKGRKTAPVLLNLHGYEFAQWLPGFNNRVKSSWLNYFFRQLIRRADFLVSLGGKITDIIKSYGIEDERIIEHKNGISTDLREMNLEKGSVRKFIFVGRYERRKGIEELLDAWDRLKHATAELHFVGPMPELLQSSTVFFHGSITSKEALNALYAHATFLVLPSYSEGMPIVILEALVHECICVVSKVGGIEAYINDRNGKLIQPGNIAELQAALQWGIDAPESELEEKRQEIRKLLPELGWEKSTDNFLSILRQRGLL